MELLVHASAPSSRKNDDIFRRQAKAYATFQPANVIAGQRDLGTQSTDKLNVLKTPAALDASVYLENTQDAWTALDSQLITSSQDSHQSVDEDNVRSEADDQNSPPLPLDSSIQHHKTTTPLPPNDSSLLARPTPRVAVSEPLSSSPVSSRSYGQGHYVPSPYVPSAQDRDLTVGYIAGLSTAEFLRTPSRQQPIRSVKDVLPQESFSSPGDDIPSQLPSTYSISDLSSDHSHIPSDPVGPPPSSPWGSLPRGSAPQPWNGVIDDESPLKGSRSSGNRPIGSSALLRQAQSSQTYRANTSARINSNRNYPSTTSQEAVSSVSLDRAVAQPDNRSSHGRTSTQSSEVRPVAYEASKRAQPSHRAQFESSTVSNTVEFADRAPSSSSQSRLTSSRDDHSTQPSREIPASARDQTQISHSKQIPLSSFESRFSSSPQAMGTQPPNDNLDESNEKSSSPGGIDLFQPVVRLPGANVRRPSSSSFPETGSNVQDEVQSDTALDLTTQLQRSRVDKRTISAVVPDTVIADKRRKYAAFSTPKAKPNSQELQTLMSLAMQINPPPPATSSDSFKTHVTSTLQSFPSDSKLAGRYRPVKVSRPLRISERGYWLIDTSSWAVATQIKFWTFLEASIKPGLCGWGIWCMRENNSTGHNDDTTARDESTEHDDTTRYNEDVAEEQHELGVVKVFCWGEVVEHVWLLCYVASVCKLRNIESTWIDAEGKVVIRI